MCAMPSNTLLENFFGGSELTGQVHELYGLANSGKTQLCIAHATSFLLRTDETDVWWISSSASLSSAAGRISDILASAGAAAAAHLRRLRCFTCFDAHSLMLLLRQAVACNVESRAGSGPETARPLTGIERLQADCDDEASFLPRGGPNLLLQAPFRLWKGGCCVDAESEADGREDSLSCEGKGSSAAGAPPAKRRALASEDTVAGSADLRAGLADTAATRAALLLAATSSRSTLARDVVPTHHAAAAASASGADGSASAAPFASASAAATAVTAAASAPPPHSSCPVGLIIVDSIADMLAPVAGGLKNFGSHALIGQVSRLLHAAATSGHGCAVLLTNNLVESRDRDGLRDRDGGRGTSSAVAPALATSTPIGGHLLVPVAPAPRFKPVLGAAWSAVPDVSTAVHGPVRLTPVQLSIAPAGSDADGRDVRAAAAGASSFRGENATGDASSSASCGAAGAAATAGKCTLVLPLPSAFTVTKGHGALGALLTKPIVVAL